MENFPYDETLYSLDDLCIDSLRIFQRRDRFRFGVDSVLLSDFAAGATKHTHRVIDLCSGCGSVALLLWAKAKPKSLTAVEIDGPSCEALCMSLKYNGLQEKIRLIHGDLLELPSALKGSFDVLTINPPYIPKAAGIENKSEAVRIARSEQTATLEEMVGVASSLLREKGMLYMVHKTHRLAEIFRACDKNRLAPKKLRFVHSFKGSKSNLVLLGAGKDGGDFLDVAPPLVIYEKEGVYTDELLSIYGMGKGQDDYGN